MSLKKETKQHIRNYIMEKIFFGQNDFVARTIDSFGVSDTTVYNLLKQLIEEKKVKKLSNGSYELRTTKKKKYSFSTSEEGLSEDIIYARTIKPYIETLPENASRIWQYSFDEMVNNALEHSNAENITITFAQNEAYTWITITDDGVGIFEHIAEFFHYPFLEDAVLSLFKGKLTTKSENHSGEGIFFSSKAVDHFSARSSGIFFKQDNTEELIYPTDKVFSGKGTRIYMALSNNTRRILKDVFDRYASIEDGFVTTSVPVAYVSDNGYPVSRSQAKRMYFGLDRFERIILDFAGVDEIGQGFADEVFRVFVNAHPDIRLEYENASEDVEKMIRHVGFKHKL